VKIEMVVPSMIAAGMETVVANLSRSLTRRGYSVGITCLQRLGELGEKLQSEGIRVRVVTTPGLGTMLWPRPLSRWFREVGPDVVHAHSGVWMKAARAAHAAGVPNVIYTMHGFADVAEWHRTLIERLAATWTTTITVVSEPMKPYVLETLRVKPSRLRVLPNGVDTDHFRPGAPTGEIRRRFGLEPDRVIIGHVGRFSPVKNHELLLHAFARVHDDRPEAFLVLVGEGPLLVAMQELTASLGIARHVGFWGVCMDMAPLYRDLDVLVLPSILEQTSMSILEAMATGLPVIATRVGGTPALLDDGGAGILIPSADVSALADALTLCIGDSAQRREIGLRARARVLAEYDHEKMVDAYEVLYAAQMQTAHHV
jgi:glycosyltransferase involved in cell wall biosynthesis